MRNWGIGTNNRYKAAHIYLESGPLWAFLGRDLTWKVCDLVPNSLNSWWHIKIDDPLYGWFDKFIKIEFVKVKYYTAKRIAKKYP